MEDNYRSGRISKKGDSKIRDIVYLTIITFYILAFLYCVFYYVIL